MKKLLIIGQQSFIDMTLSKELPKEDDVDVEVYFGDELDNMSEVYAYINSTSLFGDDKYALLRKAEKLKDIESFVEISKNCIETNILVCAESLTAKFTNLFKAAGYSVLVEPKNNGATNADVREIFKNQGLEISLGSATQIITQTRGDFSLIKQEAEKMSLFLADSENKSVNHLLEHITDDSEEKVFGIIDAFSEKKSKVALSILNKIHGDDELVSQAFFMISSRMIDIYYASINNRLLSGKADFVIKKTNGYKRYWERRELAKYIGYISSLDADIKTGKKTFRDALTELISSVA